MEDHLSLTAYIDGVRQVKLTNVQANGQSGAQALETLEGLAGKTRGSSRLEVTANWAVPPGGPEVDIWTWLADGSYHDVQIPTGAKSLISNGWFDTAGISQATNQATEMTATFIGELNPPE
jgi:hypothetical protein